MRPFILFFCTLLLLQTYNTLSMEPAKKKHRLNKRIMKTKGLKEILEESSCYTLPLPCSPKSPVAIDNASQNEHITKQPSSKRKFIKKTSETYDVPCRIEGCNIKSFKAASRLALCANLLRHEHLHDKPYQEALKNHCYAHTSYDGTYYSVPCMENDCSDTIRTKAQRHLIIGLCRHHKCTEMHNKAEFINTREYIEAQLNKLDHADI